MSILFLYRTPKKKRYFNRLKKESLKGRDVKVKGYNSLLFNFGFLSPLKPELIKPLERSVDEVFKNRRTPALNFLRPAYTLIMSIKIKCLHRGLKRYLSKSQPREVIVWNGLKHADLVLKEILKNHPSTQIYFMENGFLPQTTFYDSQGINAGSSLNKNPDFYLSQTLKNYPRVEGLKGRPSIKKTSNEAKYTEADTYKAEVLNKGYILLAFQMERDSQILDYSPWIKNMTELFHETNKARLNSNLSDLPLIVREHPSTKVKYPELYSYSSKDILFDSDTEFQEALEKASVIVTVNSSVGFEGVLMNKTVVVLGETFYQMKGLCLKASNALELIQTLNDSSTFKIDYKLKDHFLSYLHNDFLVQGDWKAPDTLHFKSFKERHLLK